MHRFFLLLPMLAGFTACQNPQPNPSNIPAQPEQTTEAAEVKLPPDFIEFYQKFHSDSLYQIEHISWPLQGDAAFAVDSTRMVKKTAVWEPENWRMHRPIDFSTSEFKRDFDVLGDELIVERIRYRAANYGLERRFVRQYNNEWELIYYSDMQERGQ